MTTLLTKIKPYIYPFFIILLGLSMIFYKSIRNSFIATQINKYQISHISKSRIESTNHSQNRVLEVGKISRKLKIMARELNIPLIAIAQLSRKIEERKAEEKRPMLSDLRESGSIEQDADIVTFIDYDRNQIDPLSSTTGSTKTLSRVEVVFYIEKHRNGRTGTVKLWFSKNEGRFINHT